MSEEITVVIADDHPIVRQGLRQTIEMDKSLRVLAEAGDGEEALKAIENFSPQIVILDIDMPLMDGRALVSYLKQNPPTAAVPIVMVTTETDPQVLDPVRRLGVLAVVEKAFPASVVGPLLDKFF